MVFLWENAERLILDFLGAFHAQFSPSPVSGNPWREQPRYEIPVSPFLSPGNSCLTISNYLGHAGMLLLQVLVS